MNLPEEEVARREQIVRDFFVKNPEASAEKANAYLKEKVGSKMRAQRVYELRTMVQTELKIPISTKNKQARAKAEQVAGEGKGETTITEAARPGKEAQEIPGVILAADEESAKAVERALKALKDRGLVDLRVDRIEGGLVVRK